MKTINKILLSSAFVLAPLFINDLNVNEKPYMVFNGLSLHKTASNLINYVSGFYKYKRRPDTKKSFSDIKNNGGDCYDYSELYKQMANDLGFKTKDILLKVKPHVYHKFVIMYDETGYVKLDMKNKSYRCYYKR